MHMFRTGLRLTILDRKPEGSKRQRTTSATPSPARELHQFASHADSEDGTPGRNGTAKKSRGAAARNTREKEMKDERDKLRQEAANKRKGRAERRRLDGEARSRFLLQIRANLCKFRFRPFRRITVSSTSFHDQNHRARTSAYRSTAFVAGCNARHTTKHHTSAIPPKRWQATKPPQGQTRKEPIHKRQKRTFHRRTIPPSITIPRRASR